jgi:hypothetical protein
MKPIWARQDSNLRPSGCKPDALPTELLAHYSGHLSLRKQGPLASLAGLLLNIRSDCRSDMTQGKRLGRPIQGEVAARNRTNPLLDFPVTLAIGSAHWSSDSGQTMEQILAETDKLMYEDKRKGPPPAR